jgi:hypothetical protein
MTALGQEWPNANRLVGSRRACRWMGRNVPKAVITKSFDDLVGGGEQHGRYGDA